MEQPKPTEFTADEFIAWALEQPTGRFELDNGIVVAMAPGRATTRPSSMWRSPFAASSAREACPAGS
jgi:Uma2 family endonuclease